MRMAHNYEPSALGTASTAGMRLQSFGAKPKAPEVLAGQQILRDFKVESHERIQVRCLWIGWSPPVDGVLKMNGPPNNAVFTEIPNLHLWFVAMSASAGCTASVMTSATQHVIPLLRDLKVESHEDI
ncbi:unnamed protein product [Ilex paraguariensis]|uniref:Uncharacterized protein n=1 Tax=Ilex paraguariensis TaxID=185542 RepID=A0ABC8TYS0_9AQUA